jgi:U3 small nucleolar RNA-associated protein 5
VIALGTDRGDVLLYSTATGSVNVRLAGAHTSAVRDVSLTRDGRIAYSCSDDGKIVEWDLVTGEAKRDWKATVSNPRAMQLSKDQRQLLVAGYRVEVWDLRKQAVTKSFTGHASMVKGALFTGDGTQSVTCAENDRTINVWDCRVESADTGAVTGK